VGKIVDKDKFEKYCKENSFEKYSEERSWDYDVRVITTSEALEEYSNHNSQWCEPVLRKLDEEGKGLITTTSFSCAEASARCDLSKEETFVIVNVCNDEGDGAFRDDPDDWELNYDIDKNFFNLKQQKLIELGKDSGVEYFSYQFGAGRNG
jgi:hypothetical protein